MSQCQQTDEISRFLNSLVTMQNICNGKQHAQRRRGSTAACCRVQSFLPAQVHTPRTWWSPAMVPVITSSPAISRRTLTLLSVMSTTCVVACTTALPISSAGPCRRVQLNELKTELAWFGRPSRLASLAIMDGSVTVINPSSAVRDLGVILDAELTMKPHIARVTSSCFYQPYADWSMHVRHSRDFSPHKYF